MIKTIINKKTFAALLSGMLLLATSCGPEEVVKAEFGISESALVFNAEGGSAPVQITASEAWTVESDAEWCMVSPGNGLGSTDVELRVDTSYLYKERQAVLTFHSGTQARQVVVNQFGYEKVIKVEEAEYVVPDYKPIDDAFVDVIISSNIDFNIELPENASWVEATKQDGNITSVPRPRKVRVTYKVNTSFDERIAEIRLVPALDKDKEAEPAVINIRQEAAPKITPSRRGDSLAVVAIARTLNTYDPTVSGKTMLNWNCVKLEEFPVENGKEGETEYRVTGLSLAIIETNETLPYQVKFLTKLESLSVRSNGNTHLKTIPLGPEVCELKNLKHLDLFAYGITSLPEEMKEMKQLESLDLSSCHFESLPIDILRNLPNLKWLGFTSNRRVDVNDLSSNKIEDIGLRGELPVELFQMDQLEYLALSNNYFEGSIPNMPVGSMPNLKYLALNYNFFTGLIPDWILQHPNFGCWNPEILLFNQDGLKDSNGKRPGFGNIPNRIPECPKN